QLDEEVLGDRGLARRVVGPLPPAVLPRGVDLPLSRRPHPPRLDEALRSLRVQLRPHAAASPRREPLHPRDVIEWPPLPVDPAEAHRGVDCPRVVEPTGGGPFLGAPDPTAFGYSLP